MASTEVGTAAPGIAVDKAGKVADKDEEGMAAGMEGTEEDKVVGIVAAGMVADRAAVEQEGMEGDQVVERVEEETVVLAVVEAPVADREAEKREGRMVGKKVGRRVGIAVERTVCKGEVNPGGRGGCSNNCSCGGSSIYDETHSRIYPEAGDYPSVDTNLD